MAGDLRSLAISLDGLLSDLEPVQLAMGLEAKDAAHEAIERSVGADRSLSGLKRKAKLGAGFDMGTPVVLNLRPKGLILLADEGRKRTSEIRPRRRGRGRKAVMTPQGPRASAMSRPSRGNPIIDPLMSDLQRRVPKAAQDAITAHVRKAIG